MKIPTDPPLVDPKIEMLSDICQEEGAILEPTIPMIVSFHIEMGRYVCCKQSNTLHVGPYSKCSRLSGKKRKYFTTLITQINFSSTIIQNVRQPSYQITERPFYTALVQHPRVLAKAYDLVHRTYPGFTTG